MLQAKGSRKTQARFGARCDPLMGRPYLWDGGTKAKASFWYKLRHSRNVYIFVEMYMFFVAALLEMDKGSISEFNSPAENTARWIFHEACINRGIETSVNIWHQWALLELRNHNIPQAKIALYESRKRGINSLSILAYLEIICRVC